ncbi:MAG: DegT/DnrJ/EryC1/StrS family aminotransferase [Chloroflexi bacterium]|nr:DegT/DnrJ/EryC1/StrS family aminotransferase [Chloroflexota bacterium]
MPESVLEPLARTLMSGYIGQGPRVDQFEKALVPLFGNQNVLTLNSGTSALHLALRLAGVGHGDEVISTPMTCSATNEPILERGARIVWADINPLTGNIDPLDVERKITPRTRAIVAVHWGGYPCDLDELNRVAHKYGVKLIEDAAHALGATYKGRRIGSHSDFACFSFQAIKHLTTVDGGALTCRTTDDYRRGKLLRWYGIDRETERKDFRCEEDIREFGYKFHMNDVCATIGLEQLKYVADIVARDQANAAYYDQRLTGLSGVTRLDYKPDRRSAYWLYTILVEDRLDFMSQMTQAGITVSQVHARNDKHTMVRDFVCNLPGVDVFTEKQVSIPVGWWLTEDQRSYIADTIIRLRR